MMIPFNVSTHIGCEDRYVSAAISSHEISGGGKYNNLCSDWIVNKLHAGYAMLTTSGTHSLELAAALSGVGPGDEVIMASFTFSSTAAAFVGRGARIVFVDIREDTLNLDERLLEQAITKHTKVIVPMHYAGVACEMDTILAIAREHGLVVVEDAAHGVMAKYKERYLGTVGDMGCYSFHATKNYCMGEGGAFLSRSHKLFERAEIYRDKGTNRKQFLLGQVDKYTWVGEGSSYSPSELNAAYLYGQLENAEIINEQRLCAWNRYYNGLKDLASAEKFELPSIPAECSHNAHLFYIKLPDPTRRSGFIKYMRNAGIETAFHYIPLHTSYAGKKYGVFSGQDTYTTRESERLVRLPMYYGLADRDIDYILNAINCYFRSDLR